MTLDTEGELVAIARIVKVRGIRGEVAADLLTDFPDRFAGLNQIRAVTADGKQIMLKLESQWLHGNRVVLKFAGYDSIETASELVGVELVVPEAECVKLPLGEFYDWQLVECRVETVDGASVGSVREVWHTNEVPTLVVESNTEQGREHLIPLAESICIEINPTTKLIRIDPPEGLLEI